MSFWYWLALGLSLGLNVLNVFRSLAQDKKNREDKDVLVRPYAEQAGWAAGREKRLLDRLKAVLDDLSSGAKENDELVVDLEDKWQAQAAEHHRGKAAGFRELLARHRG